METHVKRVVVAPSRTQRIMQGVLWFAADPMVLYRLALCASWMQILARELAPWKKRDFSTKIDCGSKEYSVLPNGLAHGICIKYDPWNYEEYMMHHGRFLFVWDDTESGFCFPTSEARRFTQRLCITDYGGAVIIKRRTGRKQKIKCYRCNYCHRFHHFVAHVEGTGKIHDLRRTCLEERYRMKTRDAFGEGGPFDDSSGSTDDSADHMDDSSDHDDSADLPAMKTIVRVEIVKYARAMKGL